MTSLCSVRSHKSVRYILGPERMPNSNIKFIIFSGFGIILIRIGLLNITVVTNFETKIAKKETFLDCLQLAGTEKGHVRKEKYIFFRRNPIST